MPQVPDIWERFRQLREDQKQECYFCVYLAGLALLTAVVVGLIVCLVGKEWEWLWFLPGTFAMMAAAHYGVTCDQFLDRFNWQTDRKRDRETDPDDEP